MAGMWIAGEERPARSGQSFEVRAPMDGLLLARVARADGEDVALAVAAAREAFWSWSEAKASLREEVLLRAADLLEREGETRMLDLLIDESGSTLTKARFELRQAVQFLRAAAGEARRLYGDTFPNDEPSRLSMVFREPLGVVGVISPFNAPLALLVKMAAFPLAAGNAVLVKPSELTPLTALAFARLCADAGLPPGVLQVVTGLGPECGRALVEHPEVRGLAFTGSTATGRAIASAAAGRLCRLQLELGGKNALIVLADSEPQEAARIAAKGAFPHAGQICMANARIIVERTIYEDFRAAFVAEAEQLYLGDLRDERTAYGPLITDAALAKVERQVAGALASGATLATGGAVQRGRVYLPTVLTGVPRRAEAWAEETFGPLACLMPADDLGEMLALANDGEYGLSAGVLTRDLPRGLSIARRVRAGAVHLGTHAFQSNTMAPVGGLGMSGLGRSGGKYSSEHFTELRWISVEIGASR